MAGADTGKAATGSDPAAEAYVVKDPEAFALNMARMVEEMGRAASAWVKPRETGEFVDASPLSAVDVAQTLAKVTEYWIADPSRVVEAQTALFAGYLNVWNNSVRRLAGEAPVDAIEPQRGDKRFADKDWQENLFFDTLKQVYVHTTRWADTMVSRAEGLDPHTRRKAAFYVRQLANALSPSNFVATNPELYRETVASNGQNLVAGMRMFAEDIAAGRGNLKLRQSDATRFEVGRDMAVTPGKVVAQNDVCQVIQYAPSTETVLKRPLLIVPPWINKFYILDLNPQKSFIRWAVGEGHTVFVVSWVNPDARQAEKGWGDYIREGIAFGLDTVERATGEREVNAIGYCVGGTLLAASLSYLKQQGDERIASCTFLTTQIDFTHAGDLKVFVDDAQLEALERSMEQRGYLEGTQMATAFNLLRSGDLIWPYFVNNYLKGKEPLPFDLLYWNSDATRMPRANHMFYLRNCYHANRLSRGEMEIDGTRIDLSKVSIPVYNLATREDHIAPARSVYEGSLALGAPVTFVLAGSGHIAGVVNPPDKEKYQFWTGPSPERETPYGRWLERAEETKGSWWPHWRDWVVPRSGERVPAREPGGGALQPIEDAPGSYVRVRS